MDVRIDGNRVRTVSTYDARILRALSRLEGQKRWGQNRSFSFENTPHNLSVWRQVFPEAAVDDPMAIAAPAAVEGGHKRPSGGHPPAALFEAALDRPTRPPYVHKSPPRRHQARALEKLAGQPASGLFMDIGTGKSWTAMTLMGMRWCAGQSDYALIVAKNGIHIQWIEEQLPKHMSPIVPWKAFIWSKGKRAERQYEEMLKFEGLKIFSINTEAIPTRTAEPFLIRFLNEAKGAAGIYVDESQDIKNIQAERTKAALKLGHLCKFRMIMTGTPIAKNVIDLFSQFKFLDERIFGHRYLTSFRSEYCIVEQTQFGPQIVGHKNTEQLYAKVDPYIFRITADEALDLPPKVYERRSFVLSDEQLQLMKQLKQNFFTELNNGAQATVKNAPSLVTRLQQISCGFLPMDDGSVRQLPNPRMAELKNIIEQRSGKIVIWCRFNIDIENVCRELGESAAHYYGKTTEAGRAKAKAEFMDPDSKILYLVASPEAAGTGMDGLQGVCQTNIYYSNSFNSLARWQSEGRTWRDGTSGTVTYFDLVARKSPDLGILANLKKKKSISDLTLDEYRKLIEMEDAYEIEQ